MTTQPVTVEMVVARYKELRAELESISARHELETAPVQDKMRTIESWLLAKMNQDGVSSYKTSEGTPYKNNSTSVTLADRAALLDYAFDPFCDMVGKATGIAKEAWKAQLMQIAKWDVLDIRAGKVGIEAQLEQTGALPPGVTRSVITTVKVRSK